MLSQRGSLLIPFKENPNVVKVRGKVILLDNTLTYTLTPLKFLVLPSNLTIVIFTLKVIRSSCIKNSPQLSRSLALEQIFLDKQNLLLHRALTWLSSLIQPEIHDSSYQSIHFSGKTSGSSTFVELEWLQCFSEAVALFLCESWRQPI